MNRAFEIRLYPTKLQEQKLNKTFGTCRFVYPNCHTLLDRDKNAALNILDEGIKILNKTGQELPIEPIDTGCNNILE